MIGYSVFHNCAKGISGRAFWEWKFPVAIGHCLGPDEDEMEGHAGKEEAELDPGFARKGRFGAGTEDEDTHGWGGGAETFDCHVATCAGWVERVSKGG